MQSMPMDVDEEIRQANDSEHVGSSVFATRTKPAMNKYQQKRLGAKKAKKLEVAASSSFVLVPAMQPCIEHLRLDASTSVKTGQTLHFHRKNYVVSVQ